MRRIVTTWVCGALLACAALAPNAAAAEGGATLEEQLKGEKITLAVDNVDISELLKLMAKARRVNIVAGPDVAGPVSVNLFEVPFEIALESILGVGGFTYFRRGGVYIVTSESDRDELPMRMTDVSTRTIRLEHADSQEVLDTITDFLSPVGKATISQGNRVIVQDAPDYMAMIESIIGDIDVPPFDTAVFQLEYAVPDEVLNSVTPLLSTRGQAVVSSGRKLIVRDSTEYLNSIRAIIVDLDEAPDQVLISCQILNVGHDDSTSLGIELQSLHASANGDITNSFTQGLVPSIADPSSESLMGFFTQVLRGDISVFMQALQEIGEVELLASPQLLVVDGERARIQVGERLGFRQTTTTETSSLEAVEFLDVGTLLEVEPTISDSGLVTLEVYPQVSSGAIGLDGLPSESTTELETTMLVADGETIVIGGLLDASKERSRKQVPLLGEIPIVGLLFGRNTWIDRKTELVILIRPDIVGPRPEPIMLDDIARVQASAERFEAIPSVDDPKEKRKRKRNWRRSNTDD